ncbi:MAG: acetoacetate decarboxylase family protein [Candidatus Jordarchaeum sp.]|uniref:acetoacetate decarboxylase family protein n=1 Tax=Candidatus Jordarchaeum sp. TaxID=2823881 RepID=UPI00404A040B
MKSIPIQAPMYPEPPYKYPGARGILIVYETEPNNIKKVLPDVLEVGDMPLAFLGIMEYPKCEPLGPYNEAYLMVQAKCGDVSAWFNPFMWVTTEEALVAGREIWGFPKKMADIELVQKEEKVMGTVERKGIKFIEAVVEPSGPLEMPFEATIMTFKQMLKGDGSGLDVKKVILTSNPLEIKKMMGGEGKIKFAKSKEDPVDLLKPTKLAASVYVEYDMTLPYGKIIKTIV